jgi:exodeoxyribonuclease X
MADLRYTAVDLETTGTDPNQDHVIEWATVAYVASNVLATDTRLVKPPIPIPPETSAIHHIIDDDVTDALGWNIEARRLARRLADADILVAHNIEFERAFIGYLAPDKPWVCTYKCALRAWPDARRFGNEALRYWLELGTDRGRSQRQSPHSALHDTQVTVNILRKLLETHSIETLLQWSREGTVLPRCPIGKYRDWAWPDIEDGYLDWIVNKAKDMRPDVLNSAQMEIKRRECEAADDTLIENQ